MAKVIGHDGSATKRCTCRGCAAIIEYTENETFEHAYGHDYLGDYSLGRAIVCPSCGNKVLVRR